MREVTKREFKRIYFDLGGGRDGWDAEYWNKTFEKDPHPGMRFMVESPETKHDTVMWIVSDYGAKEYRLFFRTQEHSDDMLQFPSAED